MLGLEISGVEAISSEQFGMRTAFVARPLEFGPDAQPDVVSESWFDCCVDSFTSLADELGAI